VAQHDDKTERPTSRRIQKAREKGQTVRSRQIPAAAVMIAGLFFLSYSGSGILQGLQGMLSSFLRITPPPDMSIAYIRNIAQEAMLRMGYVLLPIMTLIAVIAIASNVAQGGLTMSWYQLSFHWEKVSPAGALSKIFSKNGVMELVRNLALVVVVSYLSYQVMVQYLPLYPRLVLMDVRQILYWTCTICYQVCLRVGILLVVMAAIDYAFQRYRFLEQLKMTKQEVKDEFKETEGDPFTRGRIRRIQREMARKRMMSALPEADVVITNPTHYAVALSYKVNKMEAPTVVAKGVGFLAIKIKELAQKYDIPMVENRPLAQTLYKTVEVGTAIPVSLYKTVAEILAYIYKTRNRWRG
jgi:flagellar biosynthetic protein FlhB